MNAVEKKDIESLNLYFDILKKYSDEANKNEKFNHAGFDPEINKYLEDMSNKYTESFLWSAMRLEIDEETRAVITFILYYKHGLIVKSLTSGDGWVRIVFVDGGKGEAVDPILKEDVVVERKILAVKDNNSPY